MKRITLKDMKTLFKYSVYFYGENITDNEKETALNMIKAVSVNLHSEYEVTFSSSFYEACRKVGLICRK